MKTSEVRPCSRCGGSVAPLFFRVVVERHVVNMAAAQRAVGLSMLLGSERLARVFDGDEPITQTIGDSKELIFCCRCFADPDALPIAWEKAADEGEDSIDEKAPPE